VVCSPIFKQYKLQRDFNFFSLAVYFIENGQLFSVLILSGTESIFFMVTCMGLFWICGQNGVGNVRMFWLLQNSAYTGIKAFSVSLTFPLVSRLGVHKQL